MTCLYMSILLTLLTFCFFILRHVILIVYKPKCQKNTLLDSEESEAMTEQFDGDGKRFGAAWSAHRAVRGCVCGILV